MLEVVASFFSSFPHWLGTFLMAMTPVGELRLALPVAILFYKMPVWSALFWSITGNMIPVTIILLFVERFHRWVEKKSGFLSSSWLKYLEQAQQKFDSKKYEKYGLVALALFVGVPLPMTGAWTGAVIAFLLALPFKKAWVAIFVRAILSAVITLLVSLGANGIFN